MFSIASWNTQGSPLSNTGKTRQLVKLLNDYDIVFLQECGTLVGATLEEVKTVMIDTTNCRIRGVQQAGALNPRCSTAILTRIGSSYDLSDAKLVNIGTEGRFGITCTVSVNGVDVQIGTLHATSGGVGAGDLESFARQLLSYSEVNPIVIGGDFNFEAADRSGNQKTTNEEFQVGTRSRGTKFSAIDTRQQTHPSSGSKLDSFIYLKLTLASAASYGVLKRDSSDHDAVYVKFV